MLKLLVDHTTLLNGLYTVSSALPSKTSLPSLSNILLEADGDHLKLAATDLDTTVITVIPATVSTQGSIALPGKKFLEIAKEFSGSDVSIVTSGTRTVLSCGKSSFTLPSSSKDSYPSLPSTGSDSDKIILPLGLVKEAIKKTAYAVAGASEIRASLTGLFWKLSSDSLEMVATDGRRLAKIMMKGIECGSSLEVILAPKALNLLLKIVSDEPVVLSSQGPQVSFNIENTSIYSRMIEGPYPPYEKVIPQNNTHILQINRDDLFSALRRMRIVANPATHQIMFTIEHNRIILHAENTDSGEAKEDIEAIFDNDPLQIAFNGNLIMDILRNMNSEDVLFNLHDSSTAVIITEQDQHENTDYLTLVMPVRLSDTV
jgi:DNA polymerase-3 subunit beta